MLIFFLAATSWILRQSGNSSARNQLDKVTTTAMAQAKEALIGRAATDVNHPGSLPCPDVNNDGTAELTDSPGGNCPAYFGRLPWKSLGLPKLLDGNGDMLWYALSPKLRDNVAAQPINPQQPLELTLDGTPNIAAIVFSPGPPLANQNARPSGTITDYLDGSNNDEDYSYVSGFPSPTFNDRALAITQANLFSIVNRSILAKLAGVDGATGLGKYYSANSSNYPPTSADLRTELTPHFDSATNTALSNNGWYPLVSYNYVNASQTILTISIPTPVSCTITPGQMLCPYP